MKKIGLITFHDTTNFGSFLQTFGLYKAINDMRSEERRVGKECRSRWSPYH